MDVRSKIDEFCVSNMFLNGDIICLMKEIVPEYISNNSELCEHDKLNDEKSSFANTYSGNKKEKIDGDNSKIISLQS